MYGLKAWNLLSRVLLGVDVTSIRFRSYESFMDCRFISPSNARKNSTYGDLDQSDDRNWLDLLGCVNTPKYLT